MKIHDCEQGTDEWFKARLGHVTASRFKAVMGSGGTKDTYRYKLAAEIVTGTWDVGYCNKYMDMGNEREPEARKHYSLITGSKVEEVGFIEYNSGIGVSPDGLIGEDGGLEIKCVLASTHIKYIHNNTLPTPYLEQVQGTLLYTGRKWWDFISYCPEVKSRPEFIIRVYPDIDCHARISVKVDKFAKEVQKLVNEMGVNSPY